MCRVGKVRRPSATEPRRCARRLLRLGANGEEEGSEAEEEDGAFEADGPDVQAVEFDAERVVAGSRLHEDHLMAEGDHARRDAVLRDGGKKRHDDYEDCRRLNERFERRHECEPGDYVDERGDDAQVMQAAEGIADEGAGLVAALESGESAGGDDEAEKDDGAEPGAEGEDLEEAEDVHQHGTEMLHGVLIGC
jgi:hypothetical protein